jgi:hypothetical protein
MRNSLETQRTSATDGEGNTVLLVAFEMLNNIAPVTLNNTT